MTAIPFLRLNQHLLDNNPDLICYLTLINKDLLHNNAALLIFFKISDNKIYIPQDITIGTSEVISNDNYITNEMTLTAGDGDIKANAQEDHTQKTQHH